jgi:hypothetical protein
VDIFKEKIIMEELVKYLFVPLVLLALGYITEKGFENLISKPVFDQWFKPLKPYQPLLVSAFGIGVAYFARSAGLNLTFDVNPYIAAQGDIVTIFAGMMAAVIAMAFHTKTSKITAG